MKIEKLFTVLVMGGGMLAGCGGHQTKAEKSPAAPAAPSSEAAPADSPATAPASKGKDGDAGGCGWF